MGYQKKNGIARPLYDYEKIIFDSLYSSSIPDNGNNNAIKRNDSIGKHLWIKKATGLGITEFMLRYMAWLCLKDKSFNIVGLI